MLQLFKILLLLFLQFFCGLLQFIVKGLQRAVGGRQAVFDAANVHGDGDRLLLHATKRRVRLPQQRVEQTKQLRGGKVQLFAEVVNVFAL